MDLSIIIINYNTFGLTCQCIESIYKYTDDVLFEIIIVDNASTIDDPKLFKVKYPDVILVENEKNLGFAKGNNKGIENSNGKFVLLLNSDTYQEYNCIGNVYNFIRINKDIGIISPQLKYPKGENQWTSGMFPTFKNELKELVRYNKLLKNESSFCYESKVDVISGAFMMFEKNNISKIEGEKLFDGFFMYAEDLVWSYQFKKIGLNNIVLKNEYLFHIKGASFNLANDDYNKYKLNLRNEFFFIVKEQGVFIAKLIAILRLINYSLLFRSHNNRKQIVKSYINFIFRKTI